MIAPLLITLGDPNGLGPELVCRLFSGARPEGSFLVIGPESSLAPHLARSGAPRFWTRAASPREGLEAARRTPGAVVLYTPPELAGFVPDVGRATPDGGRAAGISLDVACGLLLADAPEERAAGVVTCPLNKAMLAAAGFAFPGHTEFLAERAGLGPDGVCMHLCGDVLRVSLVTTHPPLADVPRLVTRAKIVRCLRLTAELVRAQGLAGPIGVCGLNPHAGESGTIGREEIDTIIPAVEEARGLGIDAVGPLPADTLFHRAAQGAFAAVLAMYHDQGLGPLKTLHFSRAVNVTLGLPFVRTSVDHGTGYDLAGRDTADTGSLAAAIGLARTLTQARG